jgi:broad specificity phosphatase PhoE
LGLPLHIESWAHEIPTKQMTSQTFPSGDPMVLFKVQNTCYMENGNYDIPFSQWENAPGFRESDIAAARKEIVEGGRDFLARLGYREENGIYRIENPNEERVALFCHGCFLFTWISELLHIPLQVSWGSLSFTHTGITVLRFSNNPNGVTSPRCLCTSDTSHLYAHGPDTNYNGGQPI